MKVAILAGGLGTRILKYYPNTIKSLIEFDRVPFIYYQLAALSKHNISDVVVCSGHGTEELSASFKSMSFFIEHHLKLSLSISQDGSESLGTGGAVKKALPLLGNKFLVIYGDSFLDFDYQAAIWRFMSSKKGAMMVIYKNENLYDKSNVNFNGERIVEFNKDRESFDFHYIDYGANFFNAAVFENTPEKFDLVALQQRLIYFEDMDSHIVYNRFYEIGSLAGIVEFTQKARREYVFGGIH